VLSRPWLIVLPWADPSAAPPAETGPRQLQAPRSQGRTGGWNGAAFERVPARRQRVYGGGRRAVLRLV